MQSEQNAVVSSEGDYFYDPHLIAYNNHQFQQYREPSSVSGGNASRPGNYFQPYYGDQNAPNYFECNRENSRFSSNAINPPTVNQRAHSKRTTKRPKKTKKQLAFFIYARQLLQSISCISSTGDGAVIPPGQSSTIPTELKKGANKRVNTNNKSLNRQISQKENKNMANKASTDKKRLNHRHKQTHHHNPQLHEPYSSGTDHKHYQFPQNGEPIPTIAAIVTTSTSAPTTGEYPSFSLSNLFPSVIEEPDSTSTRTASNYAALFAPVNNNSNSNSTIYGSPRDCQNNNNNNHNNNHNTTPSRPAVAAVPAAEIELETELDDAEFSYHHTYPASSEPSYSAHDEYLMSSGAPSSHYHHNNNNNNNVPQIPPLNSSQSLRRRDEDSTYFNNPLRQRPGGANQSTSRFSLSGTSPLERAQSLRSNNNNTNNNHNNINSSPTTNGRGSVNNIDNIPSTMSYQRRIEEQMRQQQQANRR